MIANSILPCYLVSMIRIVIPTPLSKESIETTFPQSQCAKTVKRMQQIFPNELEVLYYYENKTGLSEIYNNHIYQPASFDIVVFMHDDVEIHDMFFVEKIKNAHNQFDIVGLAGSSTQSYSKEKPSVWHLCSEKSEDMRGIVSHYIPKGFNGTQISHYNSVYFGPSPSPVVVVDGLFMSVNVRKCFETKTIFDDTFEWHNYDTSFCLRAKQAHLTIGVYPIFVVHHGLGEWQNNREWQEADKKFKTKYVN